MPRYDAVVVGAGPGGAAAAAHLARAGAKVALLDRTHFPRDKACGGGLTPRGLAALERLKVDLDGSEAIRVGGLAMIGYGRSVTTPFPTTSRWPTEGLVARRSVLDARILEAATTSGAEFRGGCNVVGPVFEDGRCRGVRIRTESGGTEEVLADWTIAADGATSVVARAAGIASSVGSGKGFWYTALRAFVGPVEPMMRDGLPLLEFYPLKVGSGTRSRWIPAYGWVFPLPDGSANIGVDIPHYPKLGACPPLREAMDTFVERLRATRDGFGDATFEAPPVGALLPEAMYGFDGVAPGLLAIGDAAGLITPYSGEGIVYALESAELASEAITSGKGASDVESSYKRALDDRYRFQLRAGLRIMKAMRKAPLAAAAAAIGFRSERALRAGVRVMAYLIEGLDTSPGQAAPASSTVSSGYRLAKKAYDALSAR